MMAQKKKRRKLWSEELKERNVEIISWCWLAVGLVLAGSRDVQSN